MLIQDIEKLAAHNSEMPGGLNPAEQLLFLSLRNIYSQYATRSITKDVAKREKTEIMKTFDQNTLLQKCYEQAKKRTDIYARYSYEIHTDGCEVCKKLQKIMEGLKNETN